MVDLHYHIPGTHCVWTESDGHHPGPARQQRRNGLAERLTDKLNNASPPIPAKRPEVALPVLSRRSRAEGWGGFLFAGKRCAGTSAIIISAKLISP